MDVFAALRTRQSVRAFLPRPVPRETLAEVLEAALRSPSWANTQPWELHVVGGPVLEEIKARYRVALAAGEQPALELPRPVGWPPALQERITANGAAMYAAMGIAREDQAARRRFGESMHLMAGAPQVILVCMDRSLGEWSMFDLGMLCQSIMLAARARGLDTCPAVAFVAFPRVLRQVLEIPPEQKIVVGIAVGYPDPRAPVNRHRSTRLPLAAVSRWYGFGEAPGE
ncbi:MAG: nitroreductase [Armatimonadota bacterium]|nr:nitroreductase [Armatimonadota bacterium]